MTIKIIPELNIHITQAELDMLRPQYEAEQSYNTRPISFETWLRGHRKQPTAQPGEEKP